MRADDDDRHIVPREFLLVWKVRVAGQEGVVVARDAPEQIAVLDALPAEFLDVVYVVRWLERLDEVDRIKRQPRAGA